MCAFEHVPCDNMQWDSLQEKSHIELCDTKEQAKGWFKKKSSSNA